MQIKKLRWCHFIALFLQTATNLVVNYSWGGGLKDSPALFLLLRLREFM